MQSVTRGRNKKKERLKRMDGKLCEVIIRTVSRGQNELTEKLKMAADDVINIGGLVMKFTYNSIGIKRDLVRIGVDCDRNFRDC